jgi:hypothetical protein
MCIFTYSVSMRIMASMELGEVILFPARGLASAEMKGEFPENKDLE